MSDKLTISSEELAEIRIALRRTLPRDASRPPEPEPGAVGGEDASDLLARLMMLGSTIVEGRELAVTDLADRLILSEMQTCITDQALGRAFVFTEE